MELKQMIMSNAEIKAELHQLIDQIDDRFLRAVHQMVSVYQKAEDDSIIGYRVDTGEAVYAAQAEGEFEQIIEEVKQGDYMTIEDLIREKSASW